MKAGAIESHDGAPVPLGLLEAERYLGYGGEWYVRVKGGVANPGEGWQVEWLWPDGHVDQGPEIRRLWMSLEPVRLTLRLRNGTRVIEGRRVLVIPRDMQAASVNQEKQLAAFTGLLEKEDPSGVGRTGTAGRASCWPTPSCQPAAAARWAEAWLAVAKPAQDRGSRP